MKILDENVLTNGYEKQLVYVNKYKVCDQFVKSLLEMRKKLKQIIL